MQYFVRNSQPWLSLLLICGFLLRPFPVIAQSIGNEQPADNRAQAALFLPFVLSEVSLQAPQVPEVPETPDTPEEPDTPETPDANPLTINVTPDNSLAVSQTIPIEGGSLTATGADGTRYTLTIPADALLSDEEILMIPLSAASDLPTSAGLVAGVQLLPSGLRFIRPATLTIENAPAIDAGLQPVGFGYQEDGKEFYLLPAIQDNEAFSVKIYHFSGYGVTAGTAQEIQTQVTQHVPSDVADALQQKWAVRLDMVEDFQTFYQDFLLPDLLKGRSGDLRAMERALVNLPIWYDMVKYARVEDLLAEQIAEAWKHMIIQLATTIELAYADCKAGDASQVVKVMRWSRILGMLPVEQRREWVTDSYMETQLLKMVRGCATFEIDFDSTVVRDVPGLPASGTAHDSHLRAEGIRVQFDLNTRLVAPTSAPLIYKSFNLDGPVPECETSTETTNGTFNLIYGRINLNYNRGETPSFAFRFDPGHPTETIVHHCPADVKLVFEPKFWNTLFWVLHWSELYGGELYFEFKDWHYVGKSLYAELIMDRASTVEGGMQLSSTTWMVLAHTPQ